MPYPGEDKSDIEEDSHSIEQTDEPSFASQDNPIIAASRAGVFNMQAIHLDDTINVPSILQDSDKLIIRVQVELMARLKKDKWPNSTQPNNHTNPKIITHRRQLRGANTSLSQLHAVSNGTDTPDHDFDPVEVLEQVVQEKVSNNIEQEWAVRIVGEHYIQGASNQLFLYVTGISGSGKSSVASAQLSFFSAFLWLFGYGEGSN
jgi:hypothetical protein